MRSFLILLGLIFLVMLGCCGCIAHADVLFVTSGCEDFGNRQGYEIFLLIGQSNMSGSAPFDFSIPNDPTVYKWSGEYGEWLLGSDPVNIGVYGYSGGKSLGPAFAQYLTLRSDGKGRRLYCPIGLVGCAVPGSCLYQWTPGTPYYESAVQACYDALIASPTGSRIAGILWLQGECDAINEASTEEYYTQAEILFESLRIDLGNEEIPLIVGEIGDFRPGNVEAMNASLRALGSTLPATAWVESQGMTSHDGGHHFDGPSLDWLGYRFGRAFARIDKILEPDSLWSALRLP